MKKTTLLTAVSTLALAMTVAAGLFIFPAKSVKADGDVEINETKFPDPKFRDYVSRSFDKDNDNKLSASEIEDAKEVDPIASDEVPNVKGIEFFTYATKINLNFMSGLGDVDLSKNVELVELECCYSNVDSLNISGCKKLESLEIQSSGLPSIDVSNNPELKKLVCYENYFSELDVSKNTKLEILDCHWYKSDADKKDPPRITSLDVKNHSMLKELNCSGHDLTELDLTNCKDLLVLECSGNKIKELDLSACVKLKDLSCSGNKLENLDLTGLTKLESLWSPNNKLKKLDLSSNVSLKDSNLNIANNNLTELVFGEAPKLKTVWVNNNKLKTLDVSKLTGLKVLFVSDNELEKLDLTNNAKMRKLYCQNNKITELKLKNTSKWFYVDCENNKITDVSIPDCIQGFYARGNNIDKLDISKCEWLKKTYQNGEMDIGKNDDGSVYYSFFIGNPDASSDYPAENGYLSFDASTELIDGSSTTLKLDKTSANLVCDKTMTLKADLKGSDDKITWSSSDKNIATVDKTGKVKAKMAGLVTIMAEGGGKRAVCVVQVLYKDVKNTEDFWYKPTYELTNINVVKGYDKQTKFKPANECTRAQMLTFIWRLKGEPEPESKTCKFPDVKEKDYFFKPVIWAVENGITTGYGDGTFKPQNVCTRAQTVTFLWRLAGTPEPTTDKCKFSDVKEKDYFYNPVIWASEKKIVAGYKDGTFKPQGKCLRRQMVTFLYKYSKYA